MAGRPFSRWAAVLPAVLAVALTYRKWPRGELAYYGLLVLADGRGRLRQRL
jgi:hypothetical protein